MGNRMIKEQEQEQKHTQTQTQEQESTNTTELRREITKCLDLVLSRGAIGSEMFIVRGFMSSRRKPKTQKEVDDLLVEVKGYYQILLYKN